MTRIKIRYNDENEELFCVWCKDRIDLGEKYIVLIDDDTKEEMCFHLDCIPESPEEQEDEPFFGRT